MKNPADSKLPSIVLCGYERGGTTLLSEVFRNNGYESGFECGVLMCDAPKAFLKYKPYVDMLSDKLSWGIDPCEIPTICSGSFEDFYDQLISRSNPIIKESNKFFDKTPIYLSKLGRVLNRTAFINKACVIHRDPRAIFSSWAKRVVTKKSIEEAVLRHLENYCDRYVDYFLGCAAHFNNPNVLFVSFEDLCVREDFYYQKIGLFAESREFSPRGKSSRFVNVEGTGIDSSKATEFERYLSQEVQYKILEKTQLASPFFATEYERSRFGDCWDKTHSKVQKALLHQEIAEISYMVNGVYFEPLTYLLRYPDVLSAKVNPITHYEKCGINEGRSPD